MPPRARASTLEVHTFSESTHTAEDAAAAVGAELGQIVKSLVFVAPGSDGTLEPVLCLVSGPNRVDIARLAAVIGEPDVRRATAGEARDLTGYTIGGIPPIGHPRSMRVIMDPDLGRFQVVWAAAGTRPPCSRCRRPRCGCSPTPPSHRSARSAARPTCSPRARPSPADRSQPNAGA